MVMKEKRKEMSTIMPERHSQVTRKNPKMSTSSRVTLLRRNALYDNN